MTSVILDLVRKSAAEAAERRLQAELVDADRERTRQRYAEKMEPEARAILGPLAGECDLTVEEVMAGAPGYIRFRVAPHVWHGLAAFKLVKSDEEKFWRFSARTNEEVSSAVDWTTKRDLIRALDELHHMFEERRDERIRDALQRLSWTDTTDDEAMRCRLDLIDLAPERENEWQAAFAAWVERRDALAADKWAREIAFDAYMLALAAWREGYEATLSDNREIVARTQRDFNQSFTRHDVAFVAVGDGKYDDEYRYPDRAWAMKDKPDKRGYWTLYEDGRLVRRKLMRVLWVGEGVTQTVVEAGPGPWRAAVYADDAGQVIFCLPWHVDPVTERIRAELMALPEEPRITDWGEEFAQGWTADEHRRYSETVGDMQRTGIPF